MTDTSTPITIQPPKLNKEIALPEVPGFQMNISIWNLTSISIYVKDANNSVYEILSQQEPGGLLAVYYNVRTKVSVKKYRIQPLCREWGNRVLLESEFSNDDRAFYIPELNLVMGTKESVERTPHPLCCINHSTRHKVLSDTVVCEYTLVDNDGVLPQIWLMDCGEIRTLTAIKDETRLPGIYVSSNNIVTEGELLNKASRVFHPMNQVLEAMTERKSSGLLAYVFPNRLDAMTHGEPHKVAERMHAEQMATLKRDKELQALELDDLKRNHELKLIELDQKQKEVEHISKLQSLHTKDYYDAKSYVRKDSIEWWKIVPAAISSVVLVATVFKA
jgi:hypothetical protein